MKYIIDRIEENIAVLENIDTKEIININVRELPKNIHEGTVLIKEKVFKIDYKEEKRRRQLLREKLNKLKGTKL